MLEISKAIFAAPVTRVVLTTPTSAGGNAAVLAALKAPVTARDDRLTAVKADFKELPAFGPPGTITSTSPILGLRAERIEFANGVRSEERRVGKECVSTCRSRWEPDHYKKYLARTFNH